MFIIHTIHLVFNNVLRKIYPNLSKHIKQCSNFYDTEGSKTLSQAVKNTVRQCTEKKRSLSKIISLVRLIFRQLLTYLAKLIFFVPDFLIKKRDER